jgi:glycosyltransferase involved in cell wall biosynthesis
VTIPATISLLRGQLGFCARAGFDVHVVASFDDERKPPSDEPGVQFHTVPMTRSIAPMSDIAAVARLSALLLRIRPEIVQAGTPKGALLGLIAARLVGTPVRIFHVRGLAHMSGAKGRARTAEVAERACCALATQVQCVSKSVRDVLVREGFCARDKTAVLLSGSSNGVDAAKRFDPSGYASARVELRRSLGIPDESVVIGFVGRLVQDKGIETLFDAWLRLRDEFPTAILLLVGPFEEGDALTLRVTEGLTNDPRVRITQTSWGDAAPVYAMMDVLAFPSLREGFPNVPMEAAAMELPVVAARAVGTIDAIVDRRTGLLVGPQDPIELAAALGSLLRDPEYGRRLGKSARQRALTQYRPQDLWRAQAEEYNRLLRAAGRQPAEIASV